MRPESTLQRLVPAVLAMVKDPAAAKAKAAWAREFAPRRQQQVIAELKKHLP